MRTNLDKVIPYNTGKQKKVIGLGVSTEVKCILQSQGKKVCITLHQLVIQSLIFNVYPYQ